MLLTLEEEKSHVCNAIDSSICVSEFPRGSPSSNMSILDITTYKERILSDMCLAVLRVYHELSNGGAKTHSIHKEILTPISYRIMEEFKFLKACFFQTIPNTMLQGIRKELGGGEDSVLLRRSDLNSRDQHNWECMMEESLLFIQNLKGWFSKVSSDSYFQ